MPSVMMHNRYSPLQQTPFSPVLPNGNNNFQQRPPSNGSVPPAAQNVGNPDPQVAGTHTTIQKIGIFLI